MSKFVFLLSLIFVVVNGFLGSKKYKPLQNILGNAKNDNGAEVVITDYIVANDIAGARKAIRVRDVFPDTSVVSYAGFALVNVTAKNKLFFWYVPPLNGNTSAPTLIWLQGGPGGSSLFGMFAENGPYSVNADNTLTKREFSWNEAYGVIFIDNPVGAGYSYTETDTGYCTNTKTQVSSQLYNLLQQFYTVFPELLANPLYVTGESYAGHYVPGLTHKIMVENEKLEAAKKLSNEQQQLLIPLAGMAIGDGWVDPITQMGGYPDMLFGIGVSSLGEKAVFQDYVTRSQKSIEAGDMYNAFTVWDEMINGDIYPYPNYYHNVTGSNDYDNFANTNEPAALSYYYGFVTAANTRKQIHVGNATFNNGALCEMNLVNDFMVSFTQEVADVLDSAKGYSVLIYSGQLDVIIAAALTELMMPHIPWTGRDEFARAQKAVWRVSPSDPEVAGYVKQFGRLTQAVVRGAGHLVPFDQPQRSLDLLTHWINGQKFESYVNPATR